jgi:hypothetical protein
MIRIVARIERTEIRGTATQDAGFRFAQSRLQARPEPDSGTTDIHDTAANRQHRRVQERLMSRFPNPPPPGHKDVKHNHRLPFHLRCGATSENNIMSVEAVLDRPVRNEGSDGRDELPYRLR